MFGDRLVNNEDKNILSQTLNDIITLKHPRLSADLIFMPSASALLSRTRRYEPYEALDMIRAKLATFITQLSDTSVKAQSVVMLDFALQLVLRVARVLFMAGGSVLLIGGEGSNKHLCVQIAAALIGHRLHFVHPSNRAAFVDDLKCLYREAVVHNKKTTVLMAPDEADDDIALELASSFVCTGEIVSLFSANEIATIARGLTGDARRMANHSVDAHEAAKTLLIERARDNLHFAICIRPGVTLTNFATRFPALLAECSIQWVSPWERGSFQLAAEHLLKDVQIDVTVKASLIQMLIDAHYAAESITTTQGNGIVTTTPVAFMSLLRRYDDM